MRSSAVEGESVSHFGSAQTADLWFLFEDRNFMSFFLEEAGECDPGQTAA